MKLKLKLITILLIGFLIDAILSILTLSFYLFWVDEKDLFMNKFFINYYEKLGYDILREDKVVIIFENNNKTKLAFDTKNKKIILNDKNIKDFTNIKFIKFFFGINYFNINKLYE